MIRWNRESHHLSSKIVGKIRKCQHLSAENIGFWRSFSPQPKNPKKSYGFFWISKKIHKIFLGFRDPRADRAPRPPHDCKVQAQSCPSPPRPALPCPTLAPSRAAPTTLGFTPYCLKFQELTVANYGTWRSARAKHTIK